MAVDGRHLDAVRTQRLDDRIYFVAGQDEVTGDRCLVATGWLEVDPGGHPHRTRRGDRHSVHRDVVAAGDADLIDASVGMTLRADNLVDLGHVKVKGGGCGRGGRRCKRGFALSEGIVNRGGHFNWVTMLEQKASDARQKLAATQEKRSSDLTYLASLDQQIDGQVAQLKSQFQSQIVELRAKVSESDALGGAKKALVDRQTRMVQRNAASMDMLNPTLKEYSAALHKADAEKAKLGQKISQLEALEKGIYVGDDLIAIATLVQKRRDIDLDAKRLAIEETELSAQLADQKRPIDAERTRLDKLAAADVRVPGQSMVLTVEASKGRHGAAGLGCGHRRGGDRNKRACVSSSDIRAAKVARDLAVRVASG